MDNKNYDKILSDFLSEISTRRVSLLKGGVEVFITQREALCVEGIAAGMTAKSLGKSLNLSYRTVEKHLENLKRKLGCQSKQELISIYLKSRSNWL